MKILDVLASARPADLEATPDADRRYRDLDRALSQPVERSRRRKRTGVPVRRLAFGVVAVGAAAMAVAVVVAGQGPDGPPVLKKTPGDGKVGTEPIMLAAAKAEAQPLGRYWVSDTVWGQSYVVAAKTGSYVIVGAARETFEWTAVKSGGGNLFYARDLPARPQTSADKAAWRKAGSPRGFRVWSNDHYQTYTSSTGRWEADHDQARTGGGFVFSGIDNPSPNVTFAQLQKLSTDPAQVRQRYMPSRGEPAQHLQDVGTDLMKAPVPPKLLAGTMRAVPTFPGVYSVGTVTDPLGRKGIAFAADWPTTGPLAHKYGNRIQLVFSPDGEFLGEENVLTRPGGEYAKQQPGFVIDYHVMRGAAWTNKKPSPPTKLPF
jgi:hypothetical protein